MARKAPRIYVLAGVNGAGKSSIGGAMIRASGGEYYNPDEAAKALIAANPGLEQAKANAAAWRQGKRLLERAITERLDFAFETTLGGGTMTGILADAAAAGFEVRVFYVGLASPELHLERVSRRVGAGGPGDLGVVAEGLRRPAQLLGVRGRTRCGTAPVDPVQHLEVRSEAGVGMPVTRSARGRPPSRAARSSAPDQPTTSASTGSGRGGPPAARSTTS